MRVQNRIAWLDLVRGLSALAVCAGHLRSVMFLDYHALGGSSFATKLFYAATGLGHLPVMIFFVLSGFFVGGSVLQQGSAFRWPRYLTARLTRLWIVVVPALLWTLAVDLVIARVAPGVLEGELAARWHLGPKPGVYSATPLTFIANVFFLQTIAAPIFGSNRPLWSLANEACYYVVFPLLAYALRLRMRQAPRAPSSLAHGALRIACALAGLAVLALVGDSIRSGFVLWLLGAAVAWLATRVVREHSRLLVAIGCAVFFAALGLARSPSFQHQTGISPAIAVGVSFALLALTLVHLPFPVAEHGTFRRLAVGLSEVSYSLYLFHYPLVLLIGGVVYRAGQVAPSPSAFVAFVGWLLALVAGSVGFWWLFERNTNALRGWIERFAVRPTVARS